MIYIMTEEGGLKNLNFLLVRLLNKYIRTRNFIYYKIISKKILVSVLCATVEQLVLNWVVKLTSGL